jgi:hypothetical protein
MKKQTLEKNLYNLEKHVYIIDRRLSLLMEHINLRFKYRSEYPDIQIMEKEKSDND